MTENCDLTVDALAPLQTFEGILDEFNGINFASGLMLSFTNLAKATFSYEFNEFIIFQYMLPLLI